MCIHLSLSIYIYIVVVTVIVAVAMVEVEVVVVFVIVVVVVVVEVMRPPTWYTAPRNGPPAQWPSRKKGLRCFTAISDGRIYGFKRTSKYIVCSIQTRASASKGYIRV